MLSMSLLQSFRFDDVSSKWSRKVLRFTYFRYASSLFLHTLKLALNYRALAAMKLIIIHII